MALQMTPPQFKEQSTVRPVNFFTRSISNLFTSDGGRCYTGCGPGTVAPAKSLKPALIYFPSGIYRITSTINMYIYTQLVGNPLAMPVIKADSSFTDPYLLNGFPAPVNSPIVTTIVFYMQLRVSNPLTRSITYLTFTSEFCI
jgi:hypothetical protein